MKYVPHMVTFFDSIEWAGWRKGVEALVTSWIEYQRSRLHWEETWEPDGRHRYFNEDSPGVRFVIEWVARDQWALGVSWPDDWGHQHIGTGSLEELQEEANELARMGGPFGGPTSPRHNMCAFPGDRVWRVAGEVERRFEVLSETIYAHFHITRKGTINNLHLFSPGPTTLQMRVDSFKDLVPSDLRQGVLVDGKRRPWTYTAMRPLLAHMRLGERELLLVCPNPPTAVILAHTEGRLQVATMLDSSYLSEFDTAWLDEAPRWPDPQGAFGHIHVREGPPRWAVSSPPRPSRLTNGVSHSGSPAQSPPHPASTPPTTAAGAAPSPPPTTLPASPRTAEVNPRTSPAGGVSSPPRSSAPTPFSTIGTTPTASRPTASPEDSPPRPVPPPTAEAAPTASRPTPSPRPVAPPPGPTIQPPPSTAEATPASSQPTAPVVEPPPPSASSPPPIAEATPAPTGDPETPATTGTPGCIADPSGAPLPSPPSAAMADLSTSTSAEPQATDSSQPSSPVGVPPPPTSEAPEAAPPEREQPEPRFPLPENPSPAEMERHFADVEPAIPPKETGAAVAVEIWQAIGEAHRHGALPITGGWIDLVSTLHRRGWLPRLPGDRATRSALAILEGLSPLVRRLHRRRWALGLER